MRVFRILALSSALVLPLAAPALADEGEAARITVTGEGRAEASPDMATISIGVTTQGVTAAEAMAANSEQLATVLANLRAAGIEERDLQTSGLSLNPDWQGYDNAPPRITGYTASNQLNVRVRALDSLGTVLDAAVKDGANTLNGLIFGTSQEEALLDEARKRAVQNAIARAELLATAAGVELGRVVSISEGGGYAPPVPMFRMGADAAMAAPVPVAGGELSLSASVTMVWDLED
jgi:uncharacterized protein YggE